VQRELVGRVKGTSSHWAQISATASLESCSRGIREGKNPEKKIEISHSQLANWEENFVTERGEKETKGVGERKGRASEPSYV